MIYRETEKSQCSLELVPVNKQTADDKIFLEEMVWLRIRFPEETKHIRSPIISRKCWPSLTRSGQTFPT